MNSISNSGASSIRYSLRKYLNCSSKESIKHLRQLSVSRTSFESTAEVTHKIAIPKRIERKATDILKALSATVERDFTAPHFKYHDDPFLIPTSNMSKRMYALSQESGRKAAHWVRQEHADLFQHRVAEPPIEVYFPKAIYDEKSEVDENVLNKLISQHLVSDCLTVYSLLEQKGSEVSRETKQSLLELLCYFNCEDPLEEDWIEERWFRQGSRGRENKQNTWKNAGAAENLFKNLIPPDAASYSALICGRVQFGNYVGAHKLYQEALDAGLSLPVQVFNKLIEAASTLKEGYELRWQFIEEILGTMKLQGVVPDLATLNSILEILSSMTPFKHCKKNALEIVAEFRERGIELSPASYYFLLRIFCQDRSGARSAILINIMNILEGKCLKLQDPRDVLFFMEAMDVCRYHLSDLETAYRVDKLLHVGDNYNLIGDSYKESVYYRNFFALACQMGTLQEFMALYDKLVPNVYVPEPGIMELIIKTIDMNEGSDLLPRLWSDLIMFDQSDREPVICAMLTALQRSRSTNTSLLDKHADIAWAIWQKIESQRDEKRDRLHKKISWTGPMLGDILEVLLRADRYQESCEVVNCLDKRQQEILGVPSIQSLTKFLEKSIEKNEVRNAIWCIQYCSDAGFEGTYALAQKLSSSLKLSDNEKEIIKRIVGPDVLQKQDAATV